MKKILIIEDNQIVANVYRNKFAVENYQTEVALDGETGLKTMRTFQPDIIILDLMLPKMSGVDVIKQIRAEARREGKEIQTWRAMQPALSGTPRA